MSTLHKDSYACAKSELDLFGIPPTQTCMEAATVVEYNPTANISKGAIEFNVPGTEGVYLDLSQTYLYVQCEIRGADGADSVCAPSNLFFHSLFDLVDVSLNGTQITAAVTAYPYRAIIETLMNYGSDAKQSHLTSSLFYKDDAGKMDSVDTIGTNVNSGFMKRKSIGSNVFDMYGRLHTDMFFQDRLLLDKVNFRLRLKTSTNAFCLIGDEKREYKVHIEKINLYVRQVKVANDVVLAHAKMLEKVPALYPITHVELKSYTINSGVKSHTIDNISAGNLPKRIVFGLVDGDAFNGDITRNCYNFEHFSLNNVSVTVNGEHLPYSPIDMDFKEGLYNKAYYSLFNGVDRGSLDCGNYITREEYANGYTLFAFDLTPDKANGCNFNLAKSANLRIVFKFANNLEKPINCIVYMEVENVIEITKERQIVFNQIV